MAAVDQPCVREIVLHFASLVLGASIQQLLDALPTFAVTAARGAGTITPPNGITRV